MHGAKAGRPPIHARYSADLDKLPALKERYERHKTDPKLMETANEIALARAFLGYLIESHDTEIADEDYPAMVRETIESITKMVERRHKMEHGEQISLTVKNLETFVVRVLDIAKQVFGEDDRYRTFVAQLGKLYSLEGVDEGAGTVGST